MTVGLGGPVGPGSKVGRVGAAESVGGAGDSVGALVGDPAVGEEVGGSRPGLEDWDALGWAGVEQATTSRDAARTATARMGRR
jgi:hypothetical protein